VLAEGTSTPAVTISETKKESLNRPTVVTSGSNSFIIRMQFIDEETHNQIIDALKTNVSAELEETRFTTIGPLISQSLKNKAIISLLVAWAMIIIYIAFAFRNVPKSVNPWKFGICAILALVHDVLFTIGVFSIFRFEVDALFITALLTIIGFSVHDTIVVFDRIRENLKGYDPRKDTFENVCNKAMTQTMARSINTTMSTLLTLVALLIFGPSNIFHFVLALILGITIGTYSSIFIASPLLVYMVRKSKKAIE
jgi:preprotein translocase subunit SecF